MSDRSTRVNLENDQEQVINPATEDKQDDIIDNQTNGLQKTQIVTDEINPVSEQNPLSTDGDSVYAKDLNLITSDIGTFTGDIESLFNDYQEEIIDTSATNPKTFTISLKRPVFSNSIGIGSLTGDFSNVKILLKDIAGNIRQTIDDSANNTKQTSNLLNFTKQAFIEAVIEFHTSDPVKISGMLIPKIQARNISSIDGFISRVNSTETPLIADDSFIGEIEDTANYGIIIASCYSDVASVEDGLIIEFSKDRINWYWNDIYTIEALKGKTFSVQPQARWMRIRYINNSDPQSVFQLETQMKPVYIKPSSHRVADTISGQDDAELVKANLTGERPDGDYGNVAVTNGNNLKISLEEYDDAFLDTPFPVTEGFNTPIYDYIALTYIISGNGAGEIETATFKTGGSGGTTVSVLTLAYDSDDNLITVTQS